MWRRGLLYTLLAATVAATATDGATPSTFLVQKTPFEKTLCKNARNPGSLDIAGLKLRAQRMSSCACELAYALHIFIGCLAAYFMAKTAAERLEKFKHLVRVLSVFLVHYSRDLAIAQIPVPLLAAMELCTSAKQATGKGSGDRPACNIVARQKEVGSSFYADSLCSDRLITSRYLVNVLGYSEPARLWPTIPVLFYNTHNGGSGGVGIFVNLANVVNAYAHRFSGGNQHHYQQVYQNAGNYVLQHGRLPGGPQLHILGGDPGDAPEDYDLDSDAIVDEEVSRVGRAIAPQRKGVSMWVRRLSAVKDSTDPKSFRTLLMAQFLAVDPRAEEPEVIQKCTGIMQNLLYNQDLVTAIEGEEGRFSTSAEIVRIATLSVPYSRLEFEQLLLGKDDRDEWFEDLRNEHIQCTVNTNVKYHTYLVALELYVDKILRGETKHKLDEDVSAPAQEKTTLRVSLKTWRDASDVGRERYMDTDKYTKHATTAARNIIRDASAAIEARVAELTKDYPAEFDKAIEFLLERFKPEGEAEVEAAAAWRSWLKDPLHVAAVAQKASGKVKKKVKRAENGRAKARPSKRDQRRKKH